MVNSHYHRLKLKSLTTITVTNFDLDSLIDQNNLSDDSCLIVVDEKVYDLTLWIQPRLSSNQDSLQTRSVYSDHSSSHPSPPPSPRLITSPGPGPGSTLVQLNQFDRLLAMAKSDPVQAGHLLRSIHDQEIGRSDQSSLEDWIQDCRIGDFAPTISSSSSSSSALYHHPSIQVSPDPSDPILYSNFINPTPLPPNLRHSSHPSRSLAPSTSDHPPPHLLPTGYQPTDPSDPGGAQQSRIVVRSGGSSSGEANVRPSGRCHLARATGLVAQLTRQVEDAERGVGIANLSLAEAKAQLQKAEIIRACLQYQSDEGFRPIYSPWVEKNT